MHGTAFKLVQWILKFQFTMDCAVLQNFKHQISPLETAVDAGQPERQTGPRETITTGLLLPGHRGNGGACLR